ncbi:Protein Y73B6BL.16 [Aphelenchoides avenae]|nr:Protein Y73B6BL.16 [Aphelenchus avenae]
MPPRLPRSPKKSDKLGHCKKAHDADMVQCDSCDTWVHFKCENLTLSTAATLDKVFCKTCRTANPSLKNIEQITLQSILEMHKAVPEEMRSSNQKLDRLADIVADLAQTVNGLVSRVNDLERKPYGAPCEPVDLPSALEKALAERELKKKKELSAVIERLPEGGDDSVIVSEFASQCQVLDSLVVENIHRHGSGGRNPKILKVPFKTKAARDTFIKNLWSYKKSPTFPALYKDVSVRRDLTPEELKTHRALRQQCYDQNKECGQFKFLYRDLRIIELTNPQPLKTRE